MVGGQEDLPLAGIHWDVQGTVPQVLEQLIRQAASHSNTARCHARREMHINTPNPEPRRRHVQESPGGTQRAGFLAAVSVSVRGQVIQDTAKVSVTQLFVNDSGGRIPRASYTFPLPYGCAVSEFICHIGRNRVLRGKIKEREEAREAFEEAIGRNETVGLLDQHTTEVFTTTLGNIPQNARIKAEISFITLLNYKFEDGRGVTTFVLPTYIAPRYGNPPQNVEIERPPTTMGSFDARIDILAAEEIIAIASSSHAVSVEIGGGERIWQRWRDFAQSGGQENPKYGSARLSETAAHLNKDFVLTITTRPETGLERPQACIEQHHAFNDHRAVMLTIPERFMLQNQTRVFAAEIIFLVDRSGSMIDKIDAVKSAIEFFLRGIPEGKHFNIWSFGSEFESLWQRSTQYSARSLQAALSYVSRHFAADMGGTELLPALRAIINGGRNFQTTDIVVLTDGQVWDLVDTLDFVNHTRMATEGRVRFFSLGVGDAVSHSLVEGIAKAGGGYAEVIPSVFQMGLEPRVVAVLQAALTGHIGPVRLEIDDSNHQTAYEFQDTSQTDQERFRPGSRPTEPPQIALRSPVNVSTLSPFLRNRVFILYESLSPSAVLSSLRLKASTPGGDEISELVPIMALENGDSMIHKFAARALLGDLELGQSHIHIGPGSLSRNAAEQYEAVRREGVRIGCKWSLVSKWTSFYAKEELRGGNEETEHPPVGDGETTVELIDEDDGLLRPRGQQTYFDRLIIDSAVSDESDEESDEDEDADALELPGPSHESDDDGENHDRGRGGHAGEPGNDPGDSSDHGDHHGDDGDDADDDQRPQHGSSSTGDAPNQAAGRTISGHGASGSNAVHSADYRNVAPTGQHQDRRGHSKAEDPGLASIEEYVSVRMTGDTDSKSALGEWLYAASAYGKHVSPEADIIAPASNIPASTSLLETQQVEPATGEDLAKQHIVRKLVTLQAHDGSFDSNKEQLPMLFGPMFLTGVEHLGYDLVMHLLPESANKVSSVSLALAVAALLTSQFQSCENLWRLMAAKAKAFASRHIQTDGYLELEKRALGLFATFNLPTYSLRKFDLQSFVGLLGPIDPGSGTTGETQSNDPPNQLEASHEQGSPTDPKIQQPPAAGVPRQDNDSNDQFTAIQPATERCTSLEFAPYEDDDSD